MYETCRVYSENKFEKSVHLVGFIRRIYHDARSPERHNEVGNRYNVLGTDVSTLQSDH